MGQPLIRTLVLFCLIATPANALTCKDIKSAVASYGADAVVKWARGHGYSEKQIKEIARKCLS